MGHDVFISYSSKDKAVSDAACALLEQRGYRCWIAPRDILPGQEWGEAIVGIRGARIFVLIFSGNANVSQQVRREVERAAGNGLPIVPFRIEDVQPVSSLEYFISNQHWLDALKPPMERHLDYLAEVVARLLAGPRASEPAPRPPGPQAPAIEPRSAWHYLPALLFLTVLVAAAIAYSVSVRSGAVASSNNLAAGNDVAPLRENQVAPAPPPRLVAQPLRPWFDIAGVRTSADQGSFVAAAPLLRAARVAAEAENLTPAGAQLQVINTRSLEGLPWFGARNLLVLEMPARSPAAVTLRFAEPVAEIRLVRPSFGSRFANLIAPTADLLNFPGITLTALGSDNQPVDRQRREPVSQYFGAGLVPADTITLRSTEGMISLRLEADDAIMRSLAGVSRQRTIYALMFEAILVRRMPQPAVPAPEQ
jgi:hypothetical protein